MKMWEGFGDVFSDSKDKKFEMWNGFGDVFGGSPDGEPANIQDVMGTNTTSAPGSLWGIKGMLSTKDDKTGVTTEGKLGAGIGAFTGLANAYLGWQQFSLAKEQMAQNKKIFNLNFANQAQTINTSLADRQRSREIGWGGLAESTDSYMKKNAISGKGI